MAKTTTRRFTARVIGALGAVLLVLGMGSVALADTTMGATPLPESGTDAAEESTAPSSSEESTPSDEPTPPEVDLPTTPSSEPTEEVTTDLSETPAPPAEAEDPASAGRMIAPMAVGGPDGADAPYVYWTVKDAAGNPVGGATFTIQGPRDNGSGNNNSRWDDNTREVSDCVTDPCPPNSRDRDPDPGEFLVKYMNRNNNGEEIQDDRRYRVRQADAPTGYSWTEASEWRLISGVGRTPEDGAWDDRTYDFGNFAVDQIPTRPLCEPGYVYGVSSSGQMQQVAPNGAVTIIGSSATGVSYFNGLGIGAGGHRVYAIERSSGSGNSQNATVWVYNTSTGEWSSTGASTSALGGNSGTNMIGGAVDLNTGLFYFGGYQSNGNFRLYQYDPDASPQISFKGTIEIAADRSANGDIAFDAAGNLFVVHGLDTTTTVYSVTAADLAAASGGTIPSSQSASRTTQDSVNGVAFDASGKAFLGANEQVRSYDMPDWAGASVVTASLSNSADLASCSSPPTITIEKVVEGKRVNDSDRFSLTLRQGAADGTVVGTATASSPADGLQDQRIGPLPTVRNIPLYFAETADGSTNLNQYATSYRCSLDDEQFAQGNATSGSVTIPDSGQEVVCQFFNSPLVANVTVHKDVTDVNGENPEAREDWTVGATAAATVGSISSKSPNVDTQQTDDAGDASWEITFGSADSRATLSVSEQMEDGFAFQSGQCIVTHLDGTTTETSFNGPDATSVTGGIAPGDQVDCTYVNKEVPNPRLTLVKEVENPEIGTGYADAFDWTLTATGTERTVSGVTGSAAVTSQEVPAGTYQLTEAFTGDPDASPGYVWTNLVCVDANDNTVQPVVTISDDGVVSGASVTLERNTDVTCTFTNTAKPGSISWTKVDGNDAALSGSEWLIEGPDGSSQTVIDDDANDENDAPGALTVTDLVWGEYTLTETRAPAGYERTDTVFTFTIGPNNLEGQLSGGGVNGNEIPNDPVTPPSLPLTGGIGRDFFFISGAGVLTLGLGYMLYAQLRNRRKEVV